MIELKTFTILIIVYNRLNNTIDAATISINILIVVIMCRSQQFYDDKIIGSSRPIFSTG